MMATIDVVEVPGETPVKEPVLLLLLGGVELLEELDGQCNVEASWLVRLGVEAAAVEEGSVFHGFGVALPLHVDSLAAVDGIRTVQPSGGIGSRVGLLRATPETHALLGGGVVEAADTVSTSNREARFSSVVPSGQAVLTTLDLFGGPRVQDKGLGRVGLVMFDDSGASVGGPLSGEHTAVLLHEVVVAARVGLLCHHGRER